MTGMQKLIIANSANVPDIALPAPFMQSCIVANLVDIPDTHSVSRLAKCSRLYSTSSIPGGAVAFGDFNPHERSPRLVQRFFNKIRFIKPTLYPTNDV